MTCYEYGEVGHIKRDCPSLVQFGGLGQRAMVPRNQSGSRNYPPNRQVSTDSSPSVGRGRVIAATPQQGQSSQQNRPVTQARVFAMT